MIRRRRLTHHPSLSPNFCIYMPYGFPSDWLKILDPDCTDEILKASMNGFRENKRFYTVIHEINNQEPFDRAGIRNIAATRFRVHKGTTIDTVNGATRRYHEESTNFTSVKEQ